MKNTITTNRISLFLIGLVLIVLQNSCSVEKRLHLAGYHVEWHHKKHNPVSPTDNIKLDEVTTLSHSELDDDRAVTALSNNALLSSVDNDVTLISAINKIKRKDSQPIEMPSGECDIILLRNGDEIKAKITEVGTTEIKYKKCDYTDGPTYTVLKSEVFMIKYPNGTKDVFSERDDYYEEKPSTNEKQTYNNENQPEQESEKLSYSEKYTKGQIDANQYHNPGGWYIAGLILGLLGILIAALSNPMPKTFSKISGDPAYREGYSNAARKDNVKAALYGWLIWLLLFLLILAAAA